MSIAIKMDSFIAAPLNQQQLVTGLKKAFENAGYGVPFDEFPSGTNIILVFKVVLDSSRVYGTSYLRLRVSDSPSVSQQIYSTWNALAHAGANPSSEMFYVTLEISTQINFVALNSGSECKLVMLQQGSTVIALGCITPVNKPNWWDLNRWNYCFVPVTNTFNTLRACSLNPYNNSEHDASLNLNRMSLANTITNRRDILPGIIVYTQSNTGIAGRTSDDLVSVAANGTNRFDVLQIPGDNKEYLILHPNNGGLAVRTN